MEQWNSVIDTLTHSTLLHVGVGVVCVIMTKDERIFFRALNGELFRVTTGGLPLTKRIYQGL